MKHLILYVFLVSFPVSSICSQGTDPREVEEEPRPCSDPYAAKGTKEVLVLHSPRLEDNLLGDSPDRNFSIYLPPGYESSPANRYPVLYFLHGYTSSHGTFFGTSNMPGLDFETILDQLYNSEAAPPLIVISPNSNNTYRGSFYTNSLVAGEWEDFIVKDVVEYVESNYRTIPSTKSRGIAGHSMGGYGTLNLTMRHPGVFSAAILDLESYVFGQNVIENGYLLEAVNGERFEDLSFWAKTFVALAVAFDPDSSASPFPGQFPVDTSGNLIDTTWQKWLQHDPLTMLPFYKDNLKELTAIQFDCGISDEYYFYPQNASLSDSLNHYGIEHVFEGYDGDHVNRLAERIRTRLLPFFFKNLEHEVPGIIRKGPWNLESGDSLVIEMDLDGMVYIVPDSTGAVVDSVLDRKFLSVTASKNSDLKIPVSGLGYGTYLAYGVDESNSGISLPVPFSVVPFIPEITVRVTDFTTGLPIAECELVIDGSLYITDSMGEISFRGCGATNSYSVRAGIQNYSTIHTNVVVYSDTTFNVAMVKDRYLKILDRATKEPVMGVSVSSGSSNLFTNEYGMVTIHDLRSDWLAYKAQHRDYFALEDSVALHAGDTILVELTRYLAAIEFQVLAGTEPVSGQRIDLGLLSGNTDQNGMAEFFNKPARRVYYYRVEKPCYMPVFDSLFLEIDTLIYISFAPDSVQPVLEGTLSGDTLRVSSNMAGDLYLAPPGTEKVIDSIQDNSYLTYPIIQNESLSVSTSGLPGDSYLIYLIDECDKVSEALTFRVGFKEPAAGNFRIYPNPVRDFLTIEMSNQTHFETVITSSNGKVVQCRNIEGATQILDLSAIPKGIYFITIRTEETVFTGKIIRL